MFSTDRAAEIAKHIFGIEGGAARLAGENDVNFHIKSVAGHNYILKISHPDDEINNIVLQNDILQMLQAESRRFHYPQLHLTLTGELLGMVLHHDGSSIVRLFSYTPGVIFADAIDHSPRLLEQLGNQVGHLSQALSHFHHPAANRYLKWDLMQSVWVEEHIQQIENVDDQSCVEYFLQKYKTEVMPVLPRLRQSVIHGDINDYNVLVSTSSDGKEYVSGFIDFGDAHATATICELAIAVTYAILNKPDPLKAAAHVIKGYHAVFPVQEDEIDILFYLIGIRLCVSVVNSAIRKKENPSDAYLVVSERAAWELLHQFRHINLDSAVDIFRQACRLPSVDSVASTYHSLLDSTTTSKSEIAIKRRKLIGKNVSLSYEHPLLITRGSGQYLYDENGKKYLDCINNVCHVGHCHPKVVKAGQEQMAVLNTNTRYLHENLTRYAERLVATLPSPLEVCFFVCSGSEANELALRLAETHTGRSEFLVLDHGYHGNTSRLVNISPYKFNGHGGNGKPDNVHVMPMPDPIRHSDELDMSLVNTKLAAFICESLPSCGGQVVLPDHYLQRIYSVVRAAGGVCIADEVQVGLGRVGSHFWGFETQSVVPDIVTIGKPLGNGHPIGAVITTRKIADSFCNGMEYFNSFGGNTVSCAIGLAVLDVIEEENLQAHALEVGSYLKQKLLDLKNKYSVIADVRGLGLFLGVELVESSATMMPAKKLATIVVNKMKDLGILLSVDGPYHNVIKIKPPLVFTKHDSDMLVMNLSDVLSQVGMISN